MFKILNWTGEKGEKGDGQISGSLRCKIDEDFDELWQFHHHLLTVILINSSRSYIHNSGFVNLELRAFKDGW